MAAPPLLTLTGIRLSFGGRPLLDGAELSVEPFARLALVGRNGSGKSTLLKIAAGLIEFDDGERWVQPGATMRYLPQEPDLSRFASVWAYVEDGLAPGDDRHHARALLEQLGLTGEEEPRRLSGGEARRAALARAMAPEPDILLLDEPTNHLDLPAIDWLQGQLSALRSALVLISHDRRFLSDLTRAMVWIDRGQTRRSDRGFAFFEDWRDEVLEQEERDAQKLKQQIAREEDWLRHGVSARRKRNMRRVGELQALRELRRNRIAVLGKARMVATEDETSGNLVIAADEIAKSFGGQTVVRPFTTRIMRGDRVGIIGPNGAGKTTLLTMLTKGLAPDSGSVRLGAGISMVTMDQKRENLKGTVTLADALTGGQGDTVFIGDRPRHVMGYMKDFLFSPSQARTPVAALSGGERGRLMLARALARPSNLLVLDEPTNDLDLETLDLLQELLADYAGTVLVVSHDRDFLDRVATSVIAWEGPGRWQEYAGGYSDMIAQRGHGVEAKPTAPPPKPDRTGKAEPSSAPPPAATAPAPKRKLSFKEKHALETLPARIEALRKEIAGHEAVLSDPGLYSRDPDGFQTRTEALQKAETALAEAEDQWLDLEILREEIEGAG